MAETDRLLSYRKSIHVVDATVRDGGLVNNFAFTDQFVKDLYDTNLAAGIDVMEMGYKADKICSTRRNSVSGSSATRTIF